MTWLSPSRVLALLVLTVCSHAWAAPDDVAKEVPFDPSQCKKKPATTAPTAPIAVPVTWNDFEIEGDLTEDPATVRLLFTPVFTRHNSLTEDTHADALATAAKYGYHMLGLWTRDTPKGTHAVLHLVPLPLVRKVAISIDQSIFDTLLDDQVRRRMRIRTGTYLPWARNDRMCELVAEQERVDEFLHDEGYFDARSRIDEKLEDRGIELKLVVDLGSRYETGTITVENSQAESVSAKEIRDKFHHDANCIPLTSVCFSTSRFRRVQHVLDIQEVVKLFQQRGFPAARVHTSFEDDPAASIDRYTRRVRFTVRIDPRRRLYVAFEGQDQDQVTEEQLIEHLTFNEAASSDDVEANSSARSIAQYLQTRGWFDAHVTWTRERFQSRTDPQGSFDRITFRIDLGDKRPVRSLVFAGNQALSTGDLEDLIGTTEEKFSTTLFGGNTNATSLQLAADVDRIADAYRRAGYRDARVHVEVAPDPAAWSSAALTAALAAAGKGSGLHVRYHIDEGEPTLLTQIQVAFSRDDPTIKGEDQRKLCEQVLKDLSDLYNAKSFATPATADRCVAVAPDIKFREDDAAQTRDQLKNKMFDHGRPRADVAYDVAVLGPHRVAAKYVITNAEPLQIGRVVIRGNFKTRSSIIHGELQLRQGALLTQTALAEGARRLRNTGLFDSVNIVMPDLDSTTGGEVNAVVEVSERYDYLAQLDVEGGYSSYNGAFARLTPSFKNLFGLGMSFDISGTIGFDLAEYLSTQQTKLRQLSGEATLRLPAWMPRRAFGLEFQTELTAFHRRQDTPRFGVVTTDGTTLTLARTWERKRIGSRPARAITLGVHYDFRLRERPVDVLRPLGADDDQNQVPITTRTGSIGLRAEWEQRVDSHGTLSPLAAETGFRLEGEASIATPYLGGQDTFMKLSAAVSRYFLIGKDLVLRGDFRYDQGIPLGGAVLLPDVERFFAGGDATVRGYDDDRLAREIIQVGVPPLDNVQQIRILPAGGNIRMMSSIDAQLRIWRLFATAVFVDAGLITNQWGTVTADDIRPSVGIALFRMVTPFGAFAWERAIPLRPQLGDDPRGRWHISFAARAQF